MVKFLKTYQLTVTILQMESHYFTRTSLQVFFTDFDGNFKSANKTLAVHFLKQNILRLLLGTKISYFERCVLMKCFMAKCYDFYGIFMTKVFTKKSWEMLCKFKCKARSNYEFLLHNFCTRWNVERKENNKIKNEKSF